MKNKFLIFLRCMAAILPIIFWPVASGLVCIAWHGFGVDSNGYVYVGTESAIQVFDKKACIKTINIPQYRSYSFTVRNDQILLADASEIVTLSLDGNELSSRPDRGGATVGAFKKYTQ